jgi:ATP synthase F1 gamma subunit
MKAIKRELQTLEELGNLLGAYEEIASIRMRKVKNSVLQTRDFLEGLTKVFYQVKYSYKKELQDLKGEKSFKSVRKTNKKSVAVFLSANTGLYGDIISRTFDSFLDQIKKTKTDIVVVGRRGRVLFEEIEKNLELEGREVQFFDMSDSGSDPDNIKKLLAYLVNYERIVVFHGKFKDILVQEPAAVSISGDVFESDEESNQDVTDAKYLFEPSMFGVMSYFEREILSSIFEQAVHESNLSKYSSRMISLDSATEKISKEIVQKELAARRLDHRLANRKQLTILSGFQVGGA